ncbi:MAG: hypothetical protein HXX16_10165 [Bacteroidales bacterium]|nr:hypothetical protein [Bacteroidales bacterium]
MNLYFIRLFILLSFSNVQLQDSIYYSKKVFTYNVEIRKTQENHSSKKIYLATFNEVWHFDKEQKWISWEDQLQNISRKSTGVKETPSEIFLHPPRHDQYAILEFSPFPIVHFPLSVGKEWVWSLLIGQAWAKLAGITNYEKDYKFEYSYKVTGKTTFKFKGESIGCYVVEANCKSPFGNSRLITFFNDNYGFVKMDYLNMDGSRFVFSLEMVQELGEVEKLQKIFKL